MNGNVFSRSAKCVTSFLNYPVQADGLNLIFSFSRIAEELRRKLSPAFDLLFDIFKCPIMRMGRLDIVEHQRSISLNTHEQIIKVMGNTACQGTDSLYLLG